MSMDTANPERTISREVPRSPGDSPSTQADMSNNPNAAEREQSEQPQSNNRRASAPIERGSGLLSALLPRLATCAIALVAVLSYICTGDIYVTPPWARAGR